MRTLLACALVVLLLASGAAVADPWTNESGTRHGRGAHEDDHARPLERPRPGRIPRGHRPPPGECRTWYRGVPHGHQPPPYRC